MIPPPPPSDNPDPELIDALRRHRAPGEPNFDTDAAWTRFQSRTSVRSIASARSPWRRVAFVAGTAAMAAAAAFVFVRGRTAATAPNPLALTTHVAALGGRDTVLLDDGSRITLNAGSRLRYADGKGDHDVYLEGEALFEITHDPRRAFRVHAANSVIEDVGTKFVVRAVNARAVDVAVTEGEVALGTSAPSKPTMQLSAGNAATIDSAGTIAKLPPQALDRLVAWTTGALVFDNTTLAEAASEIERRYNVRVVIMDSALAKRPVVARFHGEAVPQILDAIALALGAHYDANGSTYTLRPGAK